MTQGSAMRRGIAWVFAGRTGDQLLSFAFGIVLARLLAPEVFGLLLTVQVFTGLAAFVAGGGMGQALVRAKSVSQEDCNIVFTLQLIAGCIIYALFFVTAPLFARWYDQPVYVDLVRLSGVSFLMRPFSSLPSNILYRQMRYKARTAAAMLTLLTSGVTSITLASLGHGVWSLVWGGLAGSIANGLMLMRLARWRPGVSTAFRRGGELARYGFLVSANDIVDYARSHVSVFMLSNSLGPASVGLFNRGESLARMPMRFAAGSVYDVLFRALAAEQDNLDRGRYLFARSLALVAVYATPFYVGLVWLAEPLVRGVYGPKWVEAAGPLLILSFAWPVWLIGNFSGAVAAARNCLGAELKIQIATLVVVAGAIALALPHGIRGVAWALVGSAVFTSVFMLRLALRALSATWLSTLQALLPAALLNTILALALWLADRALPQVVRAHDLLHVAAMGAIGGLVYALSAMLLPIPTLATERTRWRKLLRWRVFQRP